MGPFVSGLQSLIMLKHVLWNPHRQIMFVVLLITFVYLFISWWASIVFPFLTIMSNAIVKICVQVFMWPCILHTVNWITDHMKTNSLNNCQVIFLGSGWDSYFFLKYFEHFSIILMRFWPSLGGISYCSFGFAVSRNYISLKILWVT